MSDSVLSVEGLRTHFFTRAGVVKAQVPVGGRRIPGTALTGGLIGLLAAPVDR